MKILMLFPSHYEQNAVDDSFYKEAQICEKFGFEWKLLNTAALIDEKNFVKATKKIPKMSEPTLVMYRGWMLSDEDYLNLYKILQEKNLRLINTVEEYSNCHYLPNYYNSIKKFTARTAWLSKDNLSDVSSIKTMLSLFDAKAVVIKDYVKSQKHYWHEACYIPNAADFEAAYRVIKRFLELQGDQLAGGLIIREYLEFELIGMHRKSGIALPLEYRLFFMDGQLILLQPYWAEIIYPAESVPISQFENVARSIHSHFFCMDIARKKNGCWMIVELGDAQVSEISEGHLEKFYSNLRKQHVS